MLTIDPRLPDRWGALELGLQFRGTKLRVRVEADVVVLTSERPIDVEVSGAVVHCDAGRTEIPCKARAHPR